MARYIDADKLCKVIKSGEPNNVSESFTMGVEYTLRRIDEAPPADVVPKSEVEELIKSVDDMLDLVCAMTGLELTYCGKYAELKKKYTEQTEQQSKYFSPLSWSL